MNELIEGILIGLSSHILFAVCIYYFPRIKDISLNAFILRVANIGIDGYFLNRISANRNLYNDNSKTRTLKILTNRGDSFADETRKNDWAVARWDSKPTTKILLLNPESEYAKKRALEIKSISTIPGWNYNHFKADILNNALKLTEIPNAVVKFHDEPSVFRLTITDKYAYISGFPSSALGYEKPVFRVNRRSFLYDIFNKYYDNIWERSKIVEG